MFVIYAMLAYCAVALAIAAVILQRQRHRSAGDFSGDGFPAYGLPATDAHLLHSVTLRGRRLRFYRSPLIGPDFPWTVLRDLFEVATDGASYTVSAEWIYANNPGLAQVILTANGSELLLSHWASLELLTTLIAEADECRRLLAEFRESMAEAYVLQWAGLSREEFLALCADAQRRPHAGAM